MIDYEQAKQIALQRAPQVNAAMEYKAGFRFWAKPNVEDEGFPVPGGPDFVVSNISGKVMPWISFMVQYHPERRGKKRTF